MTDDLVNIFTLVGTTLSGLLVGSLIQYYIAKGQDERRTRQEQERTRELTGEYMKHLTNEILEAIPILDKKQLQLLSNDVWKSVVNSGHLALNFKETMVRWRD